MVQQLLPLTCQNHSRYPAKGNLVFVILMNEETKIIGLSELKLQNVNHFLDIFINFIDSV